jgi:serine/threonine protein kinase
MLLAPRPPLIIKANDRVGDRYVIKSFVGRGGMGVVYCAEDTLVNEEVAFKFLRRGVLRTEKGRQTCFCARRRWPGGCVTKISLQCMMWGLPAKGYYIFPWNMPSACRCGSFLMRYRRNRRHIPVKQAVHIMLQILDALQYAHRWVIHRDIKPENIMLLNDNQVKVLDFGLAKAVEEDAEKPADGEQPKACGGTTVVYASPEQVLRQSSGFAQRHLYGRAVAA